MRQAILTFILMVLSANISARQYDRDLLFMVEHAVKAPSGHNTQPWLFKIDKLTIEIHPDMTKTLPVVDPDNRELFISLGCALENLCIAASVKGYAAEVRTDPDGLITVNLSPQEISADFDPLFEEIPRRQSNRGVYTGKTIPPDTLLLLGEFLFQENIPARFYEKGTVGFDLIKGYIEGGNRVQMGDREFKRELKSWMRFNKKQSVRSRDGLAYDVFGAPNLPLFIAKPAIGAALNVKRQVKEDVRKIESSSHLVLFTCEEETVSGWIEMGRYLQRFLLKTGSLGLANAFMNQPTEVPDLAVEMMHSLGYHNGIPAIILRIGYADPMPYSKRKEVDEVLVW